MLELRGESYRIFPLLIWIQLIVLFLLLLALIFFFTDLNHHDSATVKGSSTSTKGLLFDEIEQIDKPVPLNNGQQGGQNRSTTIIKGEIGTDSSFRGEEENTEWEEEASPINFLHPCNYFQLATVAFLKCFGLDSTSDSTSTSSSSKRSKRK